MAKAFSGVVPSREVGVADGIVKRLHPFAQDVGSVIPEGFEAYARILHPAWRTEGDREVEVRWAEVAAWSGRTVHPEVQFEAIATQVTGRDSGPPPWNGNPPEEGTLPPDQAATLAELLRGHTESPETCWYCLWDGYGFLHGGVAYASLSPTGALPRALDQEILDGPKVHIPGRAFILFRGPVGAVTNFGESPWPDTFWFQGPNLWWPDDLAWCVASEIDFTWTYVGGSAQLIHQILAHPRFEALPAAITDGITFDSDHVNR